MEKKKVRRLLLFGAAGVVAVFLLYAFWPRPLGVDIAEVERKPMVVTIDEEARTRVRDEYVVSAPINGRLLRVDVDPGDCVERQKTVVARMTPGDPAFLDERSRAVAEAAERAAEAALRLAEADLARVKAEETYAKADAARVRALAQTNTVSQAAVDRADLSVKTASANRATAEEAVRVRRAELDSARARLLAPEEEGTLADGPSTLGLQDLSILPIRSPVDGCVLRVIEESEKVLAAGAPIVSIGDPAGGLEVLTELLSSDAVKVRPGAKAIIEDWGGEPALEGVVRRAEPYGFTKISALGVEEQRVNVIIDFTGDTRARAGLGHGFRVDVRIVIWEDENALVAPSSALFRDQGEWAVFVVEKGRARRRRVEIGHNNGVEAEIVDGLAEGESVIEYPGDRLSDGALVARRKAG
ncbi:MAG: efflux RND transporter periplasmic adaptor subunit [Amphiplicatus sp.]